MENKLKIHGMSCNHCVNRVERAVNEIDGVLSAKVSLEDEIVTVDYDETVTNLEHIKAAIEDAGYDAE